jgi:hypothetical protein
MAETISHGQRLEIAIAPASGWRIWIGTEAAALINLPGRSLYLADQSTGKK